jgi:hypothetical protein
MKGFAECDEGASLQRAAVEIQTSKQFRSIDHEVIALYNDSKISLLV